MSTSQDEVDLEARKQAGLDKLLAKGWRREDLSWFPPRDEPTKRPEDPTRRTVHVYDPWTQSFASKEEKRTPAQIERDEAVTRKFDDKRKRGMWTIKHEAVMRRHHEEIAEMFEAARSALAPRWPEQAAELHAAMRAYADKHDNRLSEVEANALLERVDRLVEALPPDAAEIARLAKLSYVGEAKYRTELREACARMGATP